jgi:hypothetical protein
MRVVEFTMSFPVTGAGSLDASAELAARAWREVTEKTQDLTGGKVSAVACPGVFDTGKGGDLGRSVMLVGRYDPECGWTQDGWGNLVEDTAERLARKLGARVVLSFRQADVRYFEPGK